MPNSGRNPDDVPGNGPHAAPDAREVARFPRPAEPVNALAFGRFVLDPVRGALLRDGSDVRLRAKSLDVLTYLVRHPGRLIAKQELMDAIWPDAAVTDDSLVQCLVEIRRALGDDQAWVHTARGRGYRFDGVVGPMVRNGEPPVVASNDERDGTAPTAAPVTRADANPPVGQAQPRRRVSRLAIGGVALALAAAGGWAVWRVRTSAAPRTAEAARVYEEGVRSGERLSREAIGQAIASYERAIVLDPEFAPAHAALANTLVVRGVFGGARPDDIYPRARTAALRAVELDPMLAEGHVALGHVRVQWDRDWRGAEESYRRGLALDPNSPRGHMLYALFLGAMNRVDESLRESETALRLRPQSPTLGAIRAHRAVRGAP